MFACSVCFYGTEVLTGKHYFQSNEILTACLNLRTGDLRAILEELKFLRQKIQLPEELDIEFNENYDRYVQQAQNLLFTMKVPDRCGSINNWEHLTFIVVRKYIQDKEAKNIHETDFWE